ncbi:hypothetical protein B0J13DRAFT_557752 [Dactylonectria estremocensis]|uniref:Ankyrin n=1 Tax=Dactylonectria estremocensis TaxID=1079267 RepID=A0A9P9J073_9HYPO|nr:hypothetical protein B0J13DRAFT_557752 [Dactylonectria estremocensis]
MEFLLDLGNLDIDSRNDNGQTLLSKARAGRYELTVKLLLDSGKVDIDSRGDDGQTPLSQATAGGYTSIFKLLRS